MEPIVQLKAAVFPALFVLEHSVFICFISAQLPAGPSPPLQAPLLYRLTPSSSSVTSLYPPPDLLLPPVIFPHPSFWVFPRTPPPLSPRPCMSVELGRPPARPLSACTVSNWQLRPLLELPPSHLGSPTPNIWTFSRFGQVLALIWQPSWKRLWVILGG